MVILKGLIGTIFSVGLCDSLEWTAVGSLSVREGVLIWKSVMVPKGLMLDHFLLEQYGGLERTYFKQCLLWTSLVVFKGLI